MTFRPMLAAEYDPEKYPLQFPVLASPKIDGIRCVVRHGQPLTRSLKPIPNRHIRAALSGLPDLDGELVVGDPTDPRAWNTTSSAVMSFDGEPVFTYVVFDTPCDGPFTERTALAQKNVLKVGGPFLKYLDHVTLFDTVDLVQKEQDWVNAGYEGIMLRDPSGPYKWGRSTAKEGYLLKMKRFDDLEARIHDVHERLHHVGEAKLNALGLTERDHKKDNFTGAGDLGAFVCQIEASSGQECIEFTVGSGFTADERAAYWDNRHNLLRRLIKVKHQGFTPDGKPRFPIFQGFRNEWDMG